ncbi:MAG: energy-coupling factor transporter transmembrane protein EcfT [Negativicutes bacterium]|nr:energy-coupling factor transporter transmembrane protein EcfT [Negativicutes bacterium]
MLNDITIGQYFPGQSIVHRLDPRAKIIGLTLFVAMVFTLAHWPGYAGTGAGLVLSYVAAGLPLRLLARAVRPLSFLLLFTVAMNALMLPGEVIWHWKFVSVSREGLIQGLTLAVRLIYLIVGSSLLTYTTSPIALTDALERLLSPGRRRGGPAHGLAMMMSIALRFIPTLIGETDRIMKAQASRGADFGHGNIVRRARNMLPLLVPLFVSAFRRADELATAMEARCYRGGEGRTRMRQLKMRAGDWVVIAGLAILLVMSLWMRYHQGGGV